MNSAARRWVIAGLTLVATTNFSFAQNPASCYGPLLSSSPPTLSAYIQSISGATVVVNGIDTAQPSMPFQWNWGDNQTLSAGFPPQHTYSSTSQNYVITITATENDGTIQTYDVPVLFVSPAFTAQSFPGISFQIPSQTVTLQTHWPYAIPGDLTYLSANAFPIYSNSDVAYIQTVIASIDYNFANNNSFLLNSVFSIDMFGDNSSMGGEANWFTTPMSVEYDSGTLDPPGVESTPQWFVLFNEVGKVTTLNTPASYSFGGNTDGPASEIYSETMGDIFSYSSGCQLISNASSYGIGPDATADIRNSLLTGAANLQSAYNTYVAQGAPFTSWDSDSGMLGTLSTLAWRFIAHAEAQGQGYQVPLTRMMTLLQMFNPSMQAAYAPQSDTPAAATFRSTLMVAAISYAFNEDLRSEFEALNFPIDDATFDALYQLASGTPVTPAVTVAPSPSSITTTQALNVTVNVNGSTTWLPTPTGSVTLSAGSYTSPATPLSSGSATITVPADTLSVGSYTFQASYTPDSNSATTYTTASGTASSSVSVGLTTPILTWTPATTILYGDPGTADVLTASANTSGSFTYTATPTGGGAAINITGGTSTLALGSYNLAANFTPTNTSVYDSAQATAALNVSGESVWIVDSSGGVSELAGNGYAFSASADPGANLAVAIDAGGNVWTVGSGSTLLEETSQTGASLLTVPSSTGGLASPAAIAIDGNGQVWVVNGNNSVSLFSNAGAALSPSTGFTDSSLSSPSGIAVDLSGSVWITNKGNNSVTRILGTAAPAAPLATAAANKTTGAKP